MGSREDKGKAKQCEEEINQSHISAADLDSFFATAQNLAADVNPSAQSSSTSHISAAAIDSSLTAVLTNLINSVAAQNLTVDGTLDDAATDQNLTVDGTLDDAATDQNLIPVSAALDSCSDIAAAPLREPGRFNLLPRDLVFKILAYCDVTALLRCKRGRMHLTKECYDIVTDEAFKRFQQRQSGIRLLIHAKVSVSFPASTSINQIYVHRPGAQPNEFEFPAYSPPLTSSGFVYFPGPKYPIDIIGATQGVICVVQEDYTFSLWNPITQETSAIPSQGSHFSAGFGYNHSSNKFSIIRISMIHESSFQPEEFNFDAGIWMQLTPITFRPTKSSCDAIVRGVPFWIVYPVVEVNDSMNPRALAWFDCENSVFVLETFPVEPRPEPHDRRDDFDGWVGGTWKCLGEIQEGLLGAVFCFPRAVGLLYHVWTREDRSTWTKTYVVNEGHIDKTNFLGFYCYRPEEFVEERAVGRKYYGEIIEEPKVERISKVGGEDETRERIYGGHFVREEIVHLGRVYANGLKLMIYQYPRIDLHLPRIGRGKEPAALLEDDSQMNGKGG